MSLLSPYWRLYRSLLPEGRRFLWVSATIEYQYLGIYLIAVNLYLLRLGFGPELIGDVTGSGIAAYSATAFLSGYLFHRRSAGRLVTLGVSFVILGLVGIALTDLVPPRVQPPWILSANAVAWMGGGLFGVGRLPYLVAVAPRGQHERVLTFTLERLMGIGLAALGGLAVTFVPGVAAGLLGCTLDDPAPYAFAILLAPAGLVPALVVFVRAARRAPQVGGHEEETASGPADMDRRRASPGAMIVGLSLFAILFNLAGTPPLYFFNLYLDDGLAVSPAIIAFIMGAARLGSMPAMLLLPALARRLSLRGILVCLSAAMAVVLVPMALWPDPLVASASFVTCSLVLVLFEPVFDLYRMDVVPSSAQTRMAGATQTATYAAQSAAGFAGGHVVVSMGYGSLFFGSSALALAAAALLAAARRPGARRAPRRLRVSDSVPTPTRSEA